MYSANLGRPGDVQSFTHGDHFECLIRKYRQWGVQARMVRTHFVVPDRFHHQSSFSAPRNDRVYSHYDDPPRSAYLDHMVDATSTVECAHLGMPDRRLDVVDRVSSAE